MLDVPPQQTEHQKFCGAGTHIGKVMVQVTDTNCPVAPAQALQQRSTGCNIQPQFSCREDRSYIITGGLGGYGQLFPTASELPVDQQYHVLNTMITLGPCVVNIPLNVHRGFSSKELIFECHAPAARR